MAKFLLAVHVLAAILLVGPVAVAASLFPRFATRQHGPEEHGVAALLHRICRGYAAVGVVVPVFGIATAARLGVLTDAWLIASLLLTAAAAGLLGARILPAQRRLLAAPTAGGGSTRTVSVHGLTMATGVFNLLWAAVVVLMILRPGSTTGA
jgi:hypothetical protein